MEIQQQQKQKSFDYLEKRLFSPLKPNLREQIFSVMEKSTDNNNLNACLSNKQTEKHPKMKFTKTKKCNEPETTTKP